MFGSTHAYRTSHGGNLWDTHLSCLSLIHIYVGEWRNALTLADSGRVKRLFDLYDDLLIDSYLSDSYNKRREAVTNAEITFQDVNGCLLYTSRCV